MPHRRGDRGPCARAEKYSIEQRVRLGRGHPNIEIHQQIRALRRAGTDRLADQFSFWY